jgi:hypothetical protein
MPSGLIDAFASLFLLIPSVPQVSNPLLPVSQPLGEIRIAWRAVFHLRVGCDRVPLEAAAQDAASF